MLEIAAASAMKAASGIVTFFGVGENNTTSGSAGKSSAQKGMTNVMPAGSEQNLEGTIKNIITTVIYVVGIISVVVIIIGGINYAMSQGDPAKVKKGKDTIMYGIIGLVIAILAFAIVTFVLQGIGNGEEAEGAAILLGR